ncbi:hypothetical protein ACRAWF_33330 [Streptomyces sp. L7]
MRRPHGFDDARRPAETELVPHRLPGAPASGEYRYFATLPRRPTHHPGAAPASPRRRRSPTAPGWDVPRSA